MNFNSEEDFLKFLEDFFPISHPFLKIPRGDDCAVIKAYKDICVSTDLFLEGVHFKLDYFSPEDVGYKALAVNISDLCAMGVKPAGFFLSLIFSKKFSMDFWQRLFKGMSELANDMEMVLAGGDLSRKDFLGLGMTIWGYGDKFITRTPQPGDLVFVVGKLGLAKVGLMILENYRTLTKEFPRSVRSFLRPRILVKEALKISTYNHVNSLMDVSDGLIKDLQRLAGYDIGIKLYKTSIEVDEEVKKFCSLTREDPLEVVLEGGEDYALLGSVEKKQAIKLEKELQAQIIGEVISQKGIWLDNEPVKPKGFDHFKE